MSSYLLYVEKEANFYTLFVWWTVIIFDKPLYCEL